MTPGFGIRDQEPGWKINPEPGSRINISELSNSVWVKILKFFFNSVLRILLRDGKIQIRDKHPGRKLNIIRSTLYKRESISAHEQQYLPIKVPSISSLVSVGMGLPLVGAERDSLSPNTPPPTDTSRHTPAQAVHFFYKGMLQGYFYLWT